MAYFTMAIDSLLNVFRKPATRLYPAVVRNNFSAARGHVSIDINTCIFCGICQKKCPTLAIKVERKEKSWEIERLQCIVCASCSEACPKKCLTIENTYTTPVAINDKGSTKQTSVQMPKEG